MIVRKVQKNVQAGKVQNLKFKGIFKRLIEQDFKPAHFFKKIDQLKLYFYRLHFTDGILEEIGQYMGIGV